MPSFKMSLSNLFIKFWKFLVLYLGCGCIWLLILRHKWLQVTSYPMPMNKKLEYKDNQKYIPKSWERSVKRKSNHNFIRVIKNHLLINTFYVCAPNLCENSLMAIPSSSLRERLFIEISSAILWCRPGYFNFFNVGILGIIHIICSVHWSRF